MLLDLDPYGKNNPDGMLPLFFKQVARELTPKLTVIFRYLVKRGNFPACRRLADVVPAAKESRSLDVVDYRPISIIPLLSKVFQ